MLLIAASILAARKLAQYEGAEHEYRLQSVRLRKGLCWAEEILKEIVSAGR